ncbi:MAG: hypothetical protein R3E89_04465 [Thiolinea sp.]
MSVNQVTAEKVTAVFADINQLHAEYRFVNTRHRSGIDGIRQFAEQWPQFFAQRLGINGSRRRAGSVPACSAFASPVIRTLLSRALTINFLYITISILSKQFTIRSY